MENRLSICASDVAVALFVEKPQGDGQNFFTGGMSHEKPSFVGRINSLPRFVRFYNPRLAKKSKKRYNRS